MGEGGLSRSPDPPPGLPLAWGLSSPSCPPLVVTPHPHVLQNWAEMVLPPKKKKTKRERGCHSPPPPAHLGLEAPKICASPGAPWHLATTSSPPQISTGTPMRVGCDGGEGPTPPALGIPPPQGTNSDLGSPGQPHHGRGAGRSWGRGCWGASSSPGRNGAWPGQQASSVSPSCPPPCPRGCQQVPRGPRGSLAWAAPRGAPAPTAARGLALATSTMTVVGTAPSPTLARPPYTSLDGIPLPTASPWVFPLG